MPTTLETNVANKNEVAFCQAIIANHVHEALTVLRGYHPKLDAGRVKRAKQNCKADDGDAKNYPQS